MVIGPILLTGAAGYGIMRSNTQSPWATPSFAVLFSYGLVGTMSELLDSDENLKKAEDALRLLSEVIPLPFLNTTFYLRSSWQEEIAYAHAVSAGIPLVTAAHENNDNIIDVVIMANIVSLAFLAFQQENMWYGGLAICAALNRFGSKHIAEKLELPEKDAVAVGFAIFAVVATRCVYGKF